LRTEPAHDDFLLLRPGYDETSDQHVVAGADREPGRDVGEVDWWWRSGRSRFPVVHPLSDDDRWSDEKCQGGNRNQTRYPD
jgi:hypothetical protein